ncbi:hypothetical protein AURDEDRAFT_176957 [Auricularia subglabra TFB-10046 SS5]|uniref:MFS general substrate transporter n=1 Tax=Auricularia subglabra (strain TFB-10046 / SS5) TaxID=717982 RepID=J0WQ44_AURST|nr:hypothetical protein AURDEDRAFT_176957 [Auricularia subglabra TFB-10046 SS5]
MLYFALPDWPAKNKGTGLTYWGIMKTMARLAVTEPRLSQCSLIAVFASFWDHYSTVKVGLFGLVGALVDRLRSPWYATLAAVGLLLAFGGVMEGAGGLSVAAVVVVFALDVGFQMQQISNATRIYTIDANARSRLNAVLIIWGFVDRALLPYRAAGALNLGWIGGMLLLLLLRVPQCPNDVWFGGWGHRAPATDAAAQDAADEFPEVVYGGDAFARVRIGWRGDPHTRWHESVATAAALLDYRVALNLDLREADDAHVVIDAPYRHN